MRYEDLSRKQLEKMTDLFLTMSLHYAGAQYTESLLRARGFGDRELAAIGFDVDGERSEMDSCMEV